MNPRSLTPRDLSLFGSLREYGLLTTEQLQRLHFPSRQTALRRLRLLAAAGFIRVRTAPTIGARVVTLTGRGVTELPGCTGTTRRRPSRVSALFLPHLVQVNEFRLRLATACAARTDIELVGFIADSQRTAHATGAPVRKLRDQVADPLHPGQELSRVPDGVFALRRDGKTALFFLEVDLGTEVIGHPGRGLLKVARFYAALLVDGRYQRYRDDFTATEPFRGFRALIVLSSARRLGNVRERCGRSPMVPAEARRFIWLAEAAELFAGDLLQATWVSLDPDDATAYTLEGAKPAGRASP